MLGVLCQNCCPLEVLSNRDACRTETPDNNSSNTPHEHLLLGDFCQCYITGFSGGTCNAFLSQRNQHTHAPIHITAPPENWPRVSGLPWSSSAITTSSSPRNVMSTSLVEKAYPEIPIAVFQWTSLGLSAFALSGRAWWAAK